MKLLKDLFFTGVSFVVLFVVLKYLGLLGSVSFAAQSAILTTGLLDADGKRSSAEDFSYDFTIADLQGNNVAFDRYKGKVVFLNLWATWCGPCRAEMAGIQKLYYTVAADSISFVMLSLDDVDDQAKVVKYVRDKRFTFPVFVASGRLPQQLRVPSIPTTFVIDKSGKIVAKEVGTTNFNTNKFRTFLRQLQGEK